MFAGYLISLVMNFVPLLSNLLSHPDGYVTPAQMRSARPCPGLAAKLTGVNVPAGFKAVVKACFATLLPISMPSSASNIQCTPMKIRLSAFSRSAQSRVNFRGLQNLAYLRSGEPSGFLPGSPHGIELKASLLFELNSSDD